MGSVPYLVQQLKLALNLMKWSTSVGIPILVLLIVLGNLFTIVSFARNYSQWSKHHVYMFFMSIFDCISALSFLIFESLVFGLFVLSNGEHYLRLLGTSALFCTLSQCLYGMQAMSLMLPIFLGLDRIHALHKPFHYRSLGNRFAFKVCAALILVNVVLVIPIVIFGRPTETAYAGKRIETCLLSPKYTPEAAFIYFSVLNTFYLKGGGPIFILLGVNICLILKIFKVLRSSRMVQRGQEEDKRETMKAVRSSVILMLLSVTYIVFVGPSAAIAMVSRFTLMDLDSSYSLEKYHRFMIIVSYSKTTAFFVSFLSWNAIGSTLSHCLSPPLQSLLAYSANFVIYIRHVKFMRNDVARLFPCAVQAD